MTLRYSNSKIISILVLLNLNAAVDTDDHDIFIKRLQDEFGLTDLVLNWFSYYHNSGTF